MSIVRSVGEHGTNAMTDVLGIQVLLNLNRHRFGDPAPEPLALDGRIGDRTVGAIRRFEIEVLGLPSSDGIVTPGDATVRALLAGLPPGPCREKLIVVMPLALPARIERYYDPLVAGMKARDITSDLRMAHFVAQIGHETASLRYTEEIADGSAYEGRRDLGNTEPGDGRRFKGRGLIQLTGRANYTAYSEDTGVDYVASPEKVASDPFVAVDVACWFWTRKGLNAFADQDDARAITKRINGGYNGLDDRLAYLQRAKAVLALPPA
jgi:putative chitinase